MSLTSIETTSRGDREAIASERRQPGPVEQRVAGDVASRILIGYASCQPIGRNSRRSGACCANSALARIVSTWTTV